MSRQAHAFRASIEPAEDAGRIRTKSVRLAESNGIRKAETPEIILWAGEGKLFISADLRRIDPDHLRIRARGARLIFHGVLRADSPSSSKTFSHVLELPYEVDFEQAEMQNDNGLISIILKRMESRQGGCHVTETSLKKCMHDYFGDSGDSTGKLKDEIAILETLERYLEFQLARS